MGGVENDNPIENLENQEQAERERVLENSRGNQTELKEEVNAMVIKKVKGEVKDIVREKGIDGYKEFRNFAKQNPKLYIQINEVLDNGLLGKLKEFITKNGLIIDQQSYDLFKKQFNFSDEVKEASDTEDKKLETKETELQNFTNILEKPEYSKIREKIGEEITIESLREYFANEENMQEFIEASMEVPEDYDRIITFFQNDEVLSPTFTKLTQKYNYPKSSSQISEWLHDSDGPKTAKQQAISLMLGEARRERSGNIITSGDTIIDTSTMTRYIQNSEENPLKLKTNEVPYETNYKYKLEKQRIIKQAGALEVKRANITDQLNDISETLDEQKSQLETAKDIGDTEEIAKLEQQINALETKLDTLKPQLEEINSEITKLERRSMELELKERGRKEKYVQEIRKQDEKTRQELQGLYDIGATMIPGGGFEKIVDYINTNNAFRGSIDLGDGYGLSQDLDFTNGEYGQSTGQNPLEIKIRFFNKLYSGNPYEPLSISTFTSGSISTIGNRAEFKNKLMNPEEDGGYGIIGGLGLNFTKVLDNLRKPLDKEKPQE